MFILLAEADLPEKEDLNIKGIFSHPASLFQMMFTANSDNAGVGGGRDTSDSFESTEISHT